VSDAGKIVALTSGGRQVTAGVQIYPPSATDPVSPAPANGDLYYNTAIEELMVYDGARAKWLSSATYTFLAGRNGATNAGNFYRGVNGMVLDAANRGFACPLGTIVSIAWSRTDADAATLDVLNNGSSVATLASAATGATRDDTVDADVSAGLLSFQNQAGGNQTSNVQIVVLLKRRA
jgi:hypothetical protein